MLLRQFLDGTHKRKSLSAGKRLQLWKQSHGRCWYCGVETAKTAFVLEHVEPRSRGGSNGTSNLVVSCYGCDKEKGRMNLAEFKAHRNVTMFYGEEHRPLTEAAKRELKFKGKRAARDRKRQYWRELRNQRINSVEESDLIYLLNTMIINAPDWATTKQYMQQRYALVGEPE